MTDTVVVALITSGAAITVGGFGIIIALINRVHNLVNSKMTEFLELVKSSAKAEGAKEERDAKQNRPAWKG